MSEKYNLDEYDKYVTFILNSHEYQFWYPTVEQGLKLEKIKDDDNQLTEFLYQQIKPANDTAPSFKEVQKSMTLKQLAKFNEMIQEELGLGDS